MSEPQIIKNADYYDLDTCEKLEADLEDMVRSWCADDTDVKATHGAIVYWSVKELLDRQAAITEREVKERVDFSLTTQIADALFPYYQERIAELTAERDELQAAIDAMNNGQFYAMYKAKCEECEQLKKVVRTQAESFKKLECELGKQ